MKEYEYIVYGIENFLVDQLVGVICQESLENKSYEDGFRRIFDSYRALREDFSQKTERSGTEAFDEDEAAAFADECKKKREKILECFVEDIHANYPGLGVRQLVEEHKRELNAEDVLTTGKRICVYPYIVSRVRLYEEENATNGN